MTIEKIYKLTIKNSAFNLTEEEVSSLYESCRKALNISITGTNPVKPFDNPTAPMYPSWPNWPTYPGTSNPNPLWHPNITCKDNSASDVMDSTTTTTTSEGIKVG